MRPPSRSMDAAQSTPDAHSEGSVVGVGWTVKQLLKVMALFGLIVAAMREADLDAKALAEARARVALLAAIENESRRDPLAARSPDSERSTAAYLKACAECASGARCEDFIQQLRARSLPPDGKGPCKEGWFGRRSALETARASHE